MNTSAVRPDRVGVSPRGTSCPALVSPASAGFLIRGCMDCGRFMGVKDGHGVSGVTHGICPECFEIRLQEDGLCVE